MLGKIGQLPVRRSYAKLPVTLFYRLLCRSDILRVDLNKLEVRDDTLEVCDVDEEEKRKLKKAGPVELLSGSEESDQSIFPLAVDDYFMTVAILSKSHSSEVCFYCS